MPISCPPMDGAALGLPNDVAAGIFAFLVENDISLSELIEALALCRKVKELETTKPMVYNALMDMLNKYQGYTAPAAAKIAKDKVPVVKPQIKKNIRRSKKSR